jgi:hypothetical protein
MTEQQWLAGSDLGEMLHHLRDSASDRKLRLFACACCRRVWHLLTDPRSQQAVTLSEAFADGQADRVSLRTACQRAFEAVTRGRLASSAEGAAQACAEEYLAYPAMAAGILRRLAPDEGEAFPGMLRCVFGNPFRAVSLDPTWRTRSVAALAQTAYEERALPTGALDAVRLAILGDALEEAGCFDAAILDHLRSPSWHVRGCWAMDLLLGRR